MTRRYERTDNFVSALPDIRRTPAQHPEHTQQHPYNAPISNAVAFAIRLAPWAIISGIVTWGIIQLAELNTAWGLIIWGGIVSAASVTLARIDSMYTPGALRKREIDALHDVHLAEIEYADKQHRRDAKVRVHLAKLQADARRIVAEQVQIEPQSHSNQVIGYTPDADPEPAIDELRNEVLTFLRLVAE